MNVYCVSNSKQRWFLKIIQIIVFISTVILSGNLLAHHSFAANYNVNKTITVDGVVTGFRFRNPHTVVNFNVTNADGSTTAWVSEGFAATSLRRVGWDKNTVKKGDLIRITGSAAHKDAPMVSLTSLSFLDANGAVVRVITGEDGETAVAGAKPTNIIDWPLELDGGIPNLSGTWTSYGAPNSLAGTGPPVAPFSDAGWVIQNAFDQANDPQVYCDKPGLIRQAGMTPHPIKITQHEDRVTFEYEEYGVVREVYFDPAKAITGIKTHFGDSIARYENGTLVIETINLLSEMANPEGNRLSDQATVVETYKRINVPGYSSSIEITIDASDPLYLAEHFIHTNTKMAIENYEFAEFTCIPPERERVEVNPAMNLFLTSTGPESGVELGGLEGADAHCASLAANVGQGEKNWHAYLSTAGANGVNARDRIGTGPWYNAKGDVVAANFEGLRGDAGGLKRASMISERGAAFSIEDDKSKIHDALAGLQAAESEGLFYCFAVDSKEN
jgi:hypothetical protein